MERRANVNVNPNATERRAVHATPTHIPSAPKPHRDHHRREGSAVAIRACRTPVPRGGFTFLLPPAIANAAPNQCVDASGSRAAEFAGGADSACATGKPR